MGIEEKVSDTNPKKRGGEKRRWSLVGLIP